MKVHRKKTRELRTAAFAVAENPTLVFQEEYCRDCDDNPKLYNEHDAAIRDIVIAAVRDSYG